MWFPCFLGFYSFCFISCCWEVSGSSQQTRIPTKCPYSVTCWIAIPSCCMILDNLWCPYHAAAAVGISFANELAWVTWDLGLFTLAKLQSCPAWMIIPWLGKKCDLLTMSRLQYCHWHNGVDRKRVTQAQCLIVGKDCCRDFSLQGQTKIWMTVHMYDRDWMLSSYLRVFFECNNDKHIALASSAFILCIFLLLLLLLLK